jgi:phosphoglycolate phosphatase-like HAD superfamily hydrolase
MPQARLVTFDLDGTLITCAPRQTTVLKAVATAHGLSVNVETVWEAKRAGKTTFSALVREGATEAKALKVAKDWQSSIEEPIWLALDTCFADTLSTLKSLRMTQFEISLVTARSQRHWVSGQLTRLGMAEFLSYVEVVSPQDATEQKAALLRKSRPLLYLGDTEIDAAAAARADVSFCALDRGQRSGDFLREKGVVNIAGRLREAFNGAGLRF